MTNKTKVCTSCGEEKPVTDFHWHYKSKGIRRHSCKVCRSEVEKERQRQPEFVKSRAAYQLKKNYGITQEEYDEKLVYQQGGCKICGLASKTKKLAVDHCHTTGKIRDLLCGPCNTGLGLFQDNPELLMLAADYLKEHRG
jgi:hypothetical protein